MTRHPQSPLQIWRNQYALVGEEIRTLRRRIKFAGPLVEHATFDRFTPKEAARIKRKMRRAIGMDQRNRLVYKSMARALMLARVGYQAEARRLWERNRQKPPESYT